MTLTMPRPTRATAAASANTTPLTREEEASLVERLHEPEARARLAAALHYFVVHTAMRYVGTGVPLDELIAAGNAGLVIAIGRFEPSRGRLMTYAGHWIRKEIRGYAFMATHAVGGEYLVSFMSTVRAYEASIIKAGGDEVEAVRLANVAQVAAGRDPMSANRMRDIVQHLRAHDKSLDVPVNDDGATGVDMLPSRSVSPEDIAVARQGTGRLSWRVRGALSKLSPKEREIVRRRFMADDPETLNAIGESIGVSRERIRQLEARAMAKLRVALEGERLRDTG